MYFFRFGAERTFSTFDFVHLSVLVVCAVIIAFVFMKRHKFGELEKKDLIAYILGGSLLFLDISFYVWKWINGQQLTFPIPMHLCSWATYIVSLSIILRKDFLFQIGIYYGFTGGLLSLLVPEFGGYSYDHMRFYQFFLLHLMILILPMIQYFMYGLKLKYKYIYITLGVMWIQAGLAFLVNMYNDTINPVGSPPSNMMFVIEPPVPLPGLLGVSPIYLVVFSFLFIGLWHALYYLLTSNKILQK